MAVVKMMRVHWGSWTKVAMVHDDEAAAAALDSPDPKFHYDLWPPDSLPICLTS